MSSGGLLPNLRLASSPSAALNVLLILVAAHAISGVAPLDCRRSHDVNGGDGENVEGMLKDEAVPRTKRGAANPDDILGSFSSFYSSKRGDIPSSFSPFYGKRSNGDVPSTFSSFYKR